jgi:hypothetical protein
MGGQGKGGFAFPSVDQYCYMFLRDLLRLYIRNEAIDMVYFTSSGPNITKMKGLSCKWS